MTEFSLTLPLLINHTLVLKQKVIWWEIGVLMNPVKVRKKDEADGCVTGRIRLSCCSHQSTGVLKNN